MRTIRIIREQTTPGNRGPARGAYALHRALRAENLPWLKIGGKLQSGEIPWIWSWEDAWTARQCAVARWPFILGPNVLFSDSAHPGRGEWENDLLDAKCCRLLFTESQWYADLIRAHCKGNQAPIVLWSYPIDPLPGGPLPAWYDVLIYLKDKRLKAHAEAIQKAWPNNVLVEYGNFRRENMLLLARRSRMCCYLSSDDRGPLALAEIMLAGCPAVGVPHGAPWIENGVSGVMVNDFQEATAAITEAIDLDREEVREWALERFAASRAVGSISAALLPIAECSPDAAAQDVATMLAKPVAPPPKSPPQENTIEARQAALTRWRQKQ